MLGITAHTGYSLEHWSAVWPTEVPQCVSLGARRTPAGGEMPGAGIALRAGGGGGNCPPDPDPAAGGLEGPPRAQQQQQGPSGALCPPESVPPL